MLSNDVDPVCVPKLCIVYFYDQSQYYVQDLSDHERQNHRERQLIFPKIWKKNSV